MTTQTVSSETSTSPVINATTTSPEKSTLPFSGSLAGRCNLSWISSFLIAGAITTIAAAVFHVAETYKINAYFVVSAFTFGCCLTYCRNMGSSESKINELSKKNLDLSQEKENALEEVRQLKSASLVDKASLETTISTLQTANDSLQKSNVDLNDKSAELEAKLSNSSKRIEELIKSFDTEYAKNGKLTKQMENLEKQLADFEKEKAALVILEGELQKAHEKLKADYNELLTKHEALKQRQNTELPSENIKQDLKVLEDTLSNLKSKLLKEEQSNQNLSSQIDSINRVIQVLCNEISVSLTKNMDKASPSLTQEIKPIRPESINFKEINNVNGISIHFNTALEQLAEQLHCAQLSYQQVIVALCEKISTLEEEVKKSSVEEKKNRDLTSEIFAITCVVEQMANEGLEKNLIRANTVLPGENSIIKSDGLAREASQKAENGSPLDSGSLLSKMTKQLSSQWLCYTQLIEALCEKITTLTEEAAKPKNSIAAYLQEACEELIVKCEEAANAMSNLPDSLENFEHVRSGIKELKEKIVNCAETLKKFVQSHANEEKTLTDSLASMRLLVRLQSEELERIKSDIQKKPKELEGIKKELDQAHKNESTSWEQVDAFLNTASTSKEG